jgi:hypothetical protein
VQDRPTAAELLREVAELLEGDVLAALDGPLQHQVRVAANLARIVEREVALGPDARRREQQLLASLLGVEGDVSELNGVLASRLRDRADPAFVRDAWHVLINVTRDKLAVNKPGHDDYDFAGEQAPTS